MLCLALRRQMLVSNLGWLIGSRNFQVPRVEQPRSMEARLVDLRTNHMKLEPVRVGESLFQERNDRRHAALEMAGLRAHRSPHSALTAPRLSHLASAASKRREHGIHEVAVQPEHDPRTG